MATNRRKSSKQACSGVTPAGNVQFFVHLVRFEAVFVVKRNDIGLPNSLFRRFDQPLLPDMTEDLALVVGFDRQRRAEPPSLSGTPPVLLRLRLGTTVPPLVFRLAMPGIPVGSRGKPLVYPGAWALDSRRKKRWGGEGGAGAAYRGVGRMELFSKNHTAARIGSDGRRFTQHRS